jgi:predicted ATP-grasp superfamily ATP-dependent carboligase
MRILVFEFTSGGGFAASPLPTSLVREGRAMLSALVADLVAIGDHEIVTTADRRLALTAPKSVEVVTVGPGAAALPDDLVSSVGAVWLIAPETGGCLERFARRVERVGKMLLGSASTAIRRASDKHRLPGALAHCGVAHPRTRVLSRHGDARAIADRLGYPIVVKPSRGAGCGGVSLARNPRELDGAIARASSIAVKSVAQAFRPARGAGLQSCDRSAGLKPCATPDILLQRYVHGVPASVSLICDGRRAVALSLNAQAVRGGSSFSYHGGCTPLDHPLAHFAIDAAIRTCEAFPDLRGCVGVDLVLSRGEAVVIEINPRLTTAYLGVRQAVNANIAAMAIDACTGTLPRPPQLCRRVRFTSNGIIVAKPLDLSLSTSLRASRYGGPPKLQRRRKDEPRGSWFDRLTTSVDA